MWPDIVSNPGPLALESDALLTAVHDPFFFCFFFLSFEVSK